MESKNNPDITDRFTIDLSKGNQVNWKRLIKEGPEHAISNEDGKFQVSWPENCILKIKSEGHEQAISSDNKEFRVNWPDHCINKIINPDTQVRN